MRLQQLLRFLKQSAQRPDAIGAQGTADADNSEAQDTPALSQSTRLDRLALQTAIIHHLEWCVLFNDHLSLEDHQNPLLGPLPSAAESGLGQWLRSARQGTASSDAGLADIAAEHEHFHELAQRALGFARQGRMDLASTLLNTDFERSRARVLDLLRQMQKS